MKKFCQFFSSFFNFFSSLRNFFRVTTVNFVLISCILNSLHFSVGSNAHEVKEKNGYESERTERWKKSSRHRCLFLLPSVSAIARNKYFLWRGKKCNYQKEKSLWSHGNCASNQQRFTVLPHARERQGFTSLKVSLFSPCRNARFNCHGGDMKKTLFNDTPTERKTCLFLVSIF